LYRKTLFSTKSATSIQNIMFLTVLVIVFLPHFQCRIYSALCMPNVSSAFTTVQNYYHWNTPQKTACNVRNRTHTHTQMLVYPVGLADIREDAVARAALSVGRQFN